MASEQYPNGDHPRTDPKVGWKNRVEYAESWRGGFAYVPGEVLTMAPMGDDRPIEKWIPALRVAQRIWPEPEHQDVGPNQIRVAEEIGPCSRIENVPDPLLFVSELRDAGLAARPNHVLFIHCGCCGPHPASAMYGAFGINPAGINPAGINPAGINPAGINPAGINPAGINPAGINPAGINPAGINPAGINPAGINPNHPARMTGLRRSSARPAAIDEAEAQALEDMICHTCVPGSPKVIVLDTGLARSKQSPTLMHAQKVNSIDGPTAAWVDEPDNDNNRHLDPGAGHGGFIAGVVNQVARGCQVTVHQVATGYGDVNEFAAAKLIESLPSDPCTILNLSFGGYAMDDEAIALAWAVRKFQSQGGVVVASAGNDSTCTPAFPAALRDVVSVGAVGPGGPATFTNYGPWVRCCAPGVDITSLFFAGFEGKGGTGPEGDDPDNFFGWARWSGTSFAAPVVVGALARMMMWRGKECTAAEAVKRVIDAPELMRIPGLGTVVNVI